MFRTFLTILAVSLTTFAVADTVIIENFSDTSDPANWQVNTTQNHTLNATVTGGVPQYVPSGPDFAGRFKATWNTASPANGTANPYDLSGPLAYYAVRYNLNAPSNLPNNKLASADGLLMADITNESAYPVKVAFVVDSVGSSQLERGPLTDLPAGGTITYQWDFATQPPVGFDTGDGAFTGPEQRVKSLLVYTAVPPADSSLSILVDNIRNGNMVPVEIPATPRPLSFLRGSGTGEATFTWEAAAGTTVTHYNVYLAQDANFGSPIINRLVFPTTPNQSVTAPAVAVTLTGLAASTNYYVAVAASSATQQSPLSAALAINLPVSGSQPTDRIVLDHDAYLPGSSDFTAKGYGFASVYNAQALSSLNRSFDTVSAHAVQSGSVPLTPKPEGITIWSNLLDGAGSESISAANISRISTFLNSGGNLIISGTNVASDLATRGSILSDELHTIFVSSNSGSASLLPVRAFSGAGTLSTACNPATNAVAYNTTDNDGILPGSRSIEQVNFTGVPRTSAVAGIGHKNSLVFLSFAFESAGDTAGTAASKTKRSGLMDKMVKYLLGQDQTAASDWQLFN